MVKRKDRTDKELTLLASKTLVNLTTNGMKGEREKGRERGRGKGGEEEGGRGKGRREEDRGGGEAQRPRRQGTHLPRFEDPRQSHSKELILLASDFR